MPAETSRYLFQNPKENKQKVRIHKITNELYEQWNTKSVIINITSVAVQVVYVKRMDILEIRRTEWLKFVKVNENNSWTFR